MEGLVYSPFINGQIFLEEEHLKQIDFTIDYKFSFNII